MKKLINGDTWGGIQDFLINADKLRFSFSHTFFAWYPLKAEKKAVLFLSKNIS